MSSNIILGENQFGKAEVRVVKITRDSDRHEIEDLNVSSQLRGDFSAAHLAGDNAHVVPTDTQKNTVYAFAREGIGSPEALLLRLGNHFTSSFDWVSGGRWEAEAYSWDRIQSHGTSHDHSFVRNGQEIRTVVLIRDGDTNHLISGLRDLTVLKTTQSGFVGYPKDRYTTLPETTDRILATDVAARWRFKTGTDFSSFDFNKSYEDVKGLLLEGFTENYSHALQQTLFDMGKKVLEAHAEIDEIKFSMPNKHHFLVDLSPFGLDNPNEVFFAADRPYGLIEATIQREESTPAAIAWSGIAGFC
ncbi:urate oxidase [Arthrobacter sp. AL08]|uniref:factor-independent urate hydroxylase n=1 Tax=unclassified Arthrobacter TaxID=235627 RepID=UPI00249C9EC7|nr:MULTISPECIES: urate oxidase [unclassified Arthrobacter]MDI3243365.1 urate oxidase [Arthrobacter sp. AL05]MDI3279384.1 urate oxidase [Arthrobacter sp. AL08]